MKVKEIVYACLDLSRASTSDDSYITEELVLFLCKKYRAFLIKKEQEKERSTTDIASEFEYQEICLNLEKVAAIDGSVCTGGYYLRTEEKVPKILEGVSPRVYPSDIFQGVNVSYVPRDKMRYIGTNSYLQNIIYASLGTDFHLYLNSSNPQFKYLKKLRLSAIFEDPEEASKLACDSDGSSTTNCNIMETDFPIRDYLVPMLIELVVKDIVGSSFRKEDTTNNAKDDTPELNRRA